MTGDLEDDFDKDSIMLGTTWESGYNTGNKSSDRDKALTFVDGSDILARQSPSDADKHRLVQLYSPQQPTVGSMLGSNFTFSGQDPLW